jgi:hypothetical protein
MDNRAGGYGPGENNRVIRIIMEDFKGRKNHSCRGKRGKNELRQSGPPGISARKKKYAGRNWQPQRKKESKRIGYAGDNNQSQDRASSG